VGPLARPLDLARRLAAPARALGEQRDQRVALVGPDPHKAERAQAAMVRGAQRQRNRAHQLGVVGRRRHQVPGAHRVALRQRGQQIVPRGGGEVRAHAPFCGAAPAARPPVWLARLRQIMKNGNQSH
jgi:hypothetical protein